MSAHEALARHMFRESQVTETGLIREWDDAAYGIRAMYRARANLALDWSVERLLSALDAQVTEAETRRGEPGHSASVTDARIDAFATVRDWIRDEWMGEL